MYEFTFEFRGLKDTITVEAECVLSAVAKFIKKKEYVSLSLISKIEYLY